MADGQPLLSVQRLKTHFATAEGVVKAVDGASFDVHAGHTLGIVGESGCGKSTVGRSILQIIDKPGQIVGGKVLLRRRVGSGLEETVDIAREPSGSTTMRQIQGGEIALVFQEPMTSFSPVHTIGNQMIELIQLHQGLSKREAREYAMEPLRMVGIPNPEQRMDEYAHQLSGGIRQRAMIAMAISCSPRLLIADEPTTALDVTTQAQILDLLRHLRDQNDMAIILITHNLGVIAEMADDVAVMYLGRVVEAGPVDDIFHAPKHPYTKALLQSIPSVYSTGRDRLPSISGSVPHPFNRPRGCDFHPRCPSAMAGVCDVHEPRYLPVAGTAQQVSCFLHHEPAGAASTAGAAAGVGAPGAEPGAEAGR